MCGGSVLEGFQELSAFSDPFRLCQLPLTPFAGYNVAPSQEVPAVVAGEDGERVVRPMRRGLLPRWREPGRRLGRADQRPRRGAAGRVDVPARAARIPR